MSWFILKLKIGTDIETDQLVLPATMVLKAGNTFAFICLYLQFTYLGYTLGPTNLLSRFNAHIREIQVGFHMRKKFEIVTP
jgi:hypothetical protein